MAGARVSRMCWMSSISSIVPAALLHLVQHLRELLLETQRFLDLVGGHIRILPVFQKAGPLMIADELDERGRVGLPVLGESLEVLEHRIHAETGEQGDG